MKTVVSIPDDIHDGAEDLARRTGRTRSEVYVDALRSYLVRHRYESVTDAMNQALDEIDPSEDPFLDAAARSVLLDGD